MENNTPSPIQKAAIVGALVGLPYLAVWDIADKLGVDQHDFGGCSSQPTRWTEALRQLESAEIIEQMPDLGCRYRLVNPAWRERSRR